MSIKLTQKGNFNNAEKYLKENRDARIKSILHRYGKKGVNLLALNTPVDTGLTAASWTYEIVENGKEFDIYFKNTNIQKGVNIAIILQYGHATGNGSYYPGVDYINPVTKSLFEEMKKDLWDEMKRI